MARRMWGLGLVAAVAAITTVVACRQLVGITDNPPTDLTSTLCGLPYGTNVCASCASASCCSESTACAGDPSCAAFEKCFGQCNGDPQCWAQCLIEFPSTDANVTALSVCMATNCDSQCGLTCGAFVGGIVEPDAAAGCQSCIVSHACGPALACAQSTSCDAISRCYKSACDTVDCQDSCALANGLDPAWSWEPDGGTGGLYGAFTTALASCESTCTLDWSCVGHVVWPTPVSASDTYHFWAKKYVGGAPVPGAPVKLCNTALPDCDMAIQMGTTDSTGEVSLPFQNNSISGPQQSGLVGFLRVTPDGFMPGDYYWTHPLSESRMYSYTELFTVAEWQEFAANVKVTPDPTRGSVNVVAYGCPNLAGSQAGIEVTVSTADKGTQSFTPSGVATNITDSTGILTFWNVPPGTFQWTTIPKALGRQAGTGTATARAGTVTTILGFVTP
ncbi:MAG: hypothetical protein ACLP1X_19335 [Polyangiaceae bacterium]